MENSRRSNKGGPGNMSGVYFYMNGKWYYGTRPDRHFHELCKPHAWDIKERVKGGVIEDI